MPDQPFLVGRLDWSWAFVAFRDIPYAPGYIASSDGRILSCWRNKGLGKGSGSCVVMTNQWRELRGGKDRDGYRKVILCVGGQRLYRRVHDVILEVFVGPRPEGMVGCHNNRDIRNNAYWNLRWDTQANNIADKVKHDTVQRGERHGNAKMAKHKVLDVRRRYAAGAVTQAQLAMEHDVSIATISAIVTGRRWGHLPLAG